MRFRRWTSIFYGIALWAQVIAGALAVSMGALLKADVPRLRAVASIPVWLLDWLTSEQSELWWQLPAMAFFAGVLGLLRKHLGSPWLWEAVKFHLDEVRKMVFEVADGDAHHHHRVTLYKRVQWAFVRRRWPWTGWMVPVERSGYTKRSGVSIFRAPDDADNAEGIAGLTWARSAVVSVSDLPQLTESSPPVDVERYARSTALTVDQARKRLPKSRSLTGIPVEVKGRMWGVIVLDSRSPAAIRSDASSSYSLISRLLGKLLEKL